MESLGGGVARLERRHGKTLILGRDLGKVVSSRAPVPWSREKQRYPRFATQRKPLRRETENAGRGFRETWSDLRSCLQPLSHHPAVTGVPTGWDSDHRRSPTSPEARPAETTRQGLRITTPPPLGTRAPAPRAPALRLRSLTASLLHYVTPGKGLERQLVTAGSPSVKSLSSGQTSGAALRRRMICLARVCGCCSNQPLSVWTGGVKMV